MPDSRQCGTARESRRAMVRRVSIRKPGPLSALDCECVVPTLGHLNDAACVPHCGRGDDPIGRNQLQNPRSNLVLRKTATVARIQRRVAMHPMKTRRDDYVARLMAIRSWVQELAQTLGRTDLSVEIDGEEPPLIRTSHLVRVRSTAGEETVVLTKEEFWNEFDLFQRSAAPRLQDALKRLHQDWAACPPGMREIR